MGALLPHSIEELRTGNDRVDSIRGGMDVCEDAGGVAAARGAMVGRGQRAAAAVAAAEDAEDGGI